VIGGVSPRQAVPGTAQPHEAIGPFPPARASCCSAAPCPGCGADDQLDPRLSTATFRVSRFTPTRSVRFCTCSSRLTAFLALRGWIVGRPALAIDTPQFNRVMIVVAVVFFSFRDDPDGYDRQTTETLQDISAMRLSRVRQPRVPGSGTSDPQTSGLRPSGPRHLFIITL